MKPQLIFTCLLAVLIQLYTSFAAPASLLVKRSITKIERVFLDRIMTAESQVFSEEFSRHFTFEQQYPQRVDGEYVLKATRSKTNFPVLVRITFVDHDVDDSLLYSQKEEELRKRACLKIVRSGYETIKTRDESAVVFYIITKESKAPGCFVESDSIPTAPIQDQERLAVSRVQDSVVARIISGIKVFSPEFSHSYAFTTVDLGQQFDMRMFEAIHKKTNQLVTINLSFALILADNNRIAKLKIGSVLNCFELIDFGVEIESSHDDSAKVFYTVTKQSVVSECTGADQDDAGAEFDNSYLTQHLTETKDEGAETVSPLLTFVIETVAMKVAAVAVIRKYSTYVREKELQAVLTAPPVMYTQPPVSTPISPYLVTFNTFSNEISRQISREYDSFVQGVKTYSVNYGRNVKAYSKKVVEEVRKGTSVLMSQFRATYADMRYLVQINPLLEVTFGALSGNIESKVLVQTMQSMPIIDLTVAETHRAALKTVLIENLNSLTTYCDTQLKQLVLILQKVQARNIQANFVNLRRMVELYEIYAALIKIGISNVFEEMRVGKSEGGEVNELFEYVRAWSVVVGDYVPGVCREYGIAL